MKYLILCTFSLMNFHLFAQQFECGETFTDPRDDKTYKTVRIGQQCWMAENINVGKMVEDHAQTDNGLIEKTCWGNDVFNCETFGGLYTWFEAMQYKDEERTQGVCPSGWHIPSRSEWEKLSSFLGDDSAGYYMKVPPDHDPAWDGNNASGFTALSGGGGYEGYFHRKGSWALFWSSTSNGEDRSWFTQLDNYWYPAPPKYHNLYIGDYYQKFNGLSVRCIKNDN